MTAAAVPSSARSTAFASIRVRLVLLEEFARLKIAFETGNVSTRAALVRELAALAREIALLEAHAPTGIALDSDCSIQALAGAPEVCIAAMGEMQQAANLATVAAVVSAVRHWRALHRDP